jgi:Fe-S cluster biogenesis protein NfuA
MFGLGLRNKIQERIRSFLGGSNPHSTEPGPTPAGAAATAAQSDANEPASDQVGPALSAAAVQAVLDEMVRPALQSDGGDITLVKVEDNDVYVRLVGACSSCPSSTITMRMGVERLLTEEFPQMRSLIQVDAGIPA